MIGLIVSIGIIIGPMIGAIIVLFIWTRAGSRRTSRR
jgi:uncharacterized protein YqgC (DUF456 family)